MQKEEIYSFLTIIKLTLLPAFAGCTEATDDNSGDQTKAGKYYTEEYPPLNSEENGEVKGISEIS
jgi:hypothetical protein